MKGTVTERTSRIIAEHLGVDLDRVLPEAHFINDLGGDSLDGIEIVMAVEEEFGIDVLDADRLPTTVAEAIAEVERIVKSPT